MKLLFLAPSVLLVSVLACQSGSGGTGVATSGGEVSETERAASSQDENRAGAADREARSQTKIQEAAMREQARIEAARERDRAAQEAWTSGAAERLQAEAERGERETEEDVPRQQPQ